MNNLTSNEFIMRGSFMVIAPLSLKPDYWERFEIKEQDLEELYNHLLEIETPLSTQEMLNILVTKRIEVEKKALLNQKPSGCAIYQPKDTYQVDQTLVFPAFNWQKGKVIGIREGQNPELSSFYVINVSLENGEVHQFASGLDDHTLNHPIEINSQDPLLDSSQVLANYGTQLSRQLESQLKANPDLVSIAGQWFPRSLLVDVNIGHLNLAEAMLDMESGGPLTTRSILEQVELATDVNSKLTEFSMNLAMTEDPRFDEVGPAGKVLWFLNRLEPEAVRETPLFLKYQPLPYDSSCLTPEMLELEASLDDELSNVPFEDNVPDEITYRLSFPHFRVGSIPLTDKIQRLFPTANESPRIQFDLILGEERQRTPAWVVRTSHYVYGLREWYESQGLIPGSILHIQRGKNPGEVVIRAEKHRPTREWIRTVLVGADGGIVFAMLKQVINANFDERMAVAVPDANQIDQIWKASKKISFEQTLLNTMRELAKLNLQGHVHAQELYAAVNIIRRCPPGPVFAFLGSHSGLNHVGDLHFHIEDDNPTEDTA